MKLKRILGWVIGLTLCLGGLVGIVAAAMHLGGLMRYPATVSEGNVWSTPSDKGALSVWVSTPYVAPGDRVAVTVGVFGGIRVAVKSLDVTFGSQELHLDGQGKDWGNEIGVEKGLGEFVVGSDTLEFAVQVPAEAEPGAVVPLHCEVGYVLAKRNLFGNSFSNQEGETSIEVPITVRSRWSAVLMRVLSAGQAVVLFVLAFLFLRGTDRMMSNWGGGSGEDDLGKLVGVTVLIWVAVYAYAGYLFFALPLLAAIGYTATWFCVVLVVLWVVGPFVLFLRFPGKQPPAEKTPPAA
jgi:hypothetical protein